MVRKFDPAERRKILLSEIGIRFCLADDFDQARVEGVLTGHAFSYLGSAIECILVGFGQPAIWLLEKAKKWLTVAIAEKQTWGELDDDNSERLQQKSLAQCDWLLSGHHDADRLRRVIELEDRYYAEAGWAEGTLDLVLPLYCDAGEFTRACEIFESTRGTVAPRNLMEIGRGDRMVYAICLYRLGRQFRREDVEGALKRFLARSVPDLLSRGHFECVAQWMKLAFWNGEESRDAAWQCVLRCYDFLPGVTRPTNDQWKG